MVKYIFGRLLMCIMSLVVIVTITFYLMHSIPGGPFDPTGLEIYSPQVKQNLITSFGLDEPLGVQYVKFWGNLFKGELGVSISHKPRTVNSIISRSLPVSSRLGACAVVIVLIFGCFAGIYAALNQGKWQDRTIKVLTPIIITIPSFVLSTLLIYVFGLQLQRLGSAIGPIKFSLGPINVNTMIKGLPFMRLETPAHYILPVIAMTGGPIAYLTRLSRSSMLDVVRQDYIRTAKAKGLPNRIVIYKHALKNAMLPIFTFVGPLVVGMLTGGSMVIEKIFAIPGIGGEMISAISNRDYPMILGLTTFYSMILVATYLLVDIVYAFLDPRIKFSK